GSKRSSESETSALIPEGKRFRHSHPKGSGYAPIESWMPNCPYGLDGCTLQTPSCVSHPQLSEGLRDCEVVPRNIERSNFVPDSKSHGRTKNQFCPNQYSNGTHPAHVVKRGCFKSEPTMCQANRYDIVCDMRRVLKVMTQRSDGIFRCRCTVWIGGRPHCRVPNRGC